MTKAIAFIALFCGLIPHSFSQETPKRLQVKGRVVDASKQRMFQASVVLIDLQTLRVYQTKTEPDGTFVFDRLLVNEHEYQIIASPGEGSTCRRYVVKRFRMKWQDWSRAKELELKVPNSSECEIS